ncbi:hypothetical protein FHU40_000997 [Nocardioides soli]|uniref:Uncharacterized protein n=1 Tax=Nocardioides soli TaxID=1036020 RepID=A0A7W4VSX8_9ACTN|nr:hypothetical protein [Nocardioides soli]
MSRPLPVCPAYDVWGGYRLRCVLPVGHDGDHLASELEPVLSGASADTGPTETAAGPDVRTEASVGPRTSLSSGVSAEGPSMLPGARQSRLGQVRDGSGV